MKASDLFVKCLEKEGVERIYGVPGEENADMMISLIDSKIDFVLCRHEQAAAAACSWRHRTKSILLSIKEIIMSAFSSPGTP